MRGRPASWARRASVSSSAKVEVAGFSTITWAPALNESIAGPKWEVGGVVTWTTSGRAFSSMARWSVNHARTPYLSAAASAVAGDRSPMAATSTPRRGFREGRGGPAACPAPRRAAPRGGRKVRPQVRHEAGQLARGPGQRQERRRRPAADDLAACLGVRLGDARPGILDEVGHAVDIGDSGEEAEINDGSAVGRR